ncbi:MAG: nucleotidyltransferase domain-containing protein [Candidatus Bathyarchaeia archaeon]
MTLVEKLLNLLLTKLGDKIISVVIYGSVAPGSVKKDSDINILAVVESLPENRLERQQLFIRIEEPLEPYENELWDKGFSVDFSPIILSMGRSL